MKRPDPYLTKVWLRYVRNGLIIAAVVFAYGFLSYLWPPFYMAPIILAFGFMFGSMLNEMAHERAEKMRREDERREG